MKEALQLLAPILLISLVQPEVGLCLTIGFSGLALVGTGYYVYDEIKRRLE